MKRMTVVMVLIGVLFVAACGAEPTPVPSKALPTASPTEALPAATPTEDPFESPLPTEGPFESPVSLPNPASKFCEDQGYHIEMRSTDAGTVGYCIFLDGSECEEWAYFRGECEPGVPEP